MKKYYIIFILMSFLSCKVHDLSKQDYKKTPKELKEKRIVEDTNTVFYFIRHAQKLNDGSDDSNLSDSGREQVKKYISYFKDKRLDSVFTTNFNRTIQTGVPIAQSKNIYGDFYNPNHVVAEDWIKKHKGQAILIVGHSNTTPHLVNKFIGQMKYMQMMDDNFSDIYRIIISNEKIYEDLLNLEEEVLLQEIHLNGEEKNKNLR